eukprot:GHVT01088654.1.p1 GENE.GHVT01088654.1~~GHVT01088654.1.p1  ORF type:complete len:226 (+),score=27.50 GHVT01088654.1:631-1308(+)
MASPASFSTLNAHTCRPPKLRSVTVTAPATTANMGCGFDCMGMAVDVWNDVTIQESDQFKVTIEGEGAEKLPTDETNFVVRGCQAAYKALGIPFPPLAFRCVNRIPFDRGLGSSSAALCSGLLAGLLLSGAEVNEAQQRLLYSLAANMEGHADNAAATIYGGLQLAYKDKEWEAQRLAFPAGLTCIFFLPNSTMATSVVTFPLTKPLLPNCSFKKKLELILGAQL